MNPQNFKIKDKVKISNRGSCFYDLQGTIKELGKGSRFCIGVKLKEYHDIVPFSHDELIKI